VKGLRGIAFTLGLTFVALVVATVERVKEGSR
jgi:hypothetical protein